MTTSVEHCGREGHNGHAYGSFDHTSLVRTLTTDRGHLLRLCLTHDWDRVIQVCAFLEEHSGSNPYMQTRERCVDQLLACDQYGNSVLQACCYYRPPATVVRAILKVAQKLRCCSDLIFHKALDQSTAIQVACATGSSVAVLRAILTQPAISSRTCNSLHPGTLVGEADQLGATPLSDLVVQYTLERKGQLYVNRSNALENIHNVEAEKRASPIFRTFWSKVVLLVHAAWAAATVSTPGWTETLERSTSPQIQLSVLHRAAVVARTCPALLADMLVRCFSSSTRQSLLPLHCLLSIRRMPTECPIILRQQQEYFLARLLLAHPESAGVSFGTNGCDIPLFCAMRQGHSWHSIRRSDGLPTRNDNIGPLQHICLLAPDSVSQREPVTGCYPWQWAALVGCQRFGATDGDDLQLLDTIYQLLRHYPQSIPDSETPVETIST